MKKSLQDKKLILVTGSHRSGTTFVSKILSSSIETGFISEPLNKEIGLTGINHWFPYVPSENPERSLYKELVDSLYKKTPMFVDIKKEKILKKIVFNAIGNVNNLYFKHAMYNPLVKKVVIKDPIGCFTSEYLHKNYMETTVVLWKHPAAFVLSLKRVGWSFDFNELFSQDLLLKNYLRKLPSLNKIMESDSIEKAAYLWKAIYLPLSLYVKRNKNMHFYRIEDVGKYPIEIFKDICEKVDIPFGKRIRRAIIVNTEADKIVSGKDAGIHIIRRDSRKSLNQWRDYLTDREKEKIYNIVHNVSGTAYSESEW